MLNEKKCPACGKWTDGSKSRCAFCDSLIDPTLIAAENRKKRDEETRKKELAEENRFERYLRKLQYSDKWYHKLFFGILNVFFNIYMAILSFFIWLITIVSG